MYVDAIGTWLFTCPHDQDLQQRLDNSERRARERERDKDDEIADLKRRLRDAESRARQAEPNLDAKQREIEVCNLLQTCTSS